MLMKAVFFDMFNTLADPHHEMERRESDCIGLTPEEWNSYFWNPWLDRMRSMGEIKTEREIIAKACGLLPFNVTDGQIETIRCSWNERMRLALCDVRPEILEVLHTLKSEGYKIGLISNADVIDKIYWDESPLKKCFDYAVFSCDVAMIKPEPFIYELAISNIGCSPGEAVYVGDGGNDELAGAKAVGMTTILAEHIIRRNEETRARTMESADYMIDDFRQLPALIGSIFGAS